MKSNHFTSYRHIVLYRDHLENDAVYQLNTSQNILGVIMILVGLFDLIYQGLYKKI